jgi:hypothetical protein
MTGLLSKFSTDAEGSGVAEGNCERDHDHAGEGEIEVHEVSIQSMRDVGILNRSREIEKFGFVI